MSRNSGERLQRALDRRVGLVVRPASGAAFSTDLGASVETGAVDSNGQFQAFGRFDVTPADEFTFS